MRHFSLWVGISSVVPLFPYKNKACHFHISVSLSWSKLKPWVQYKHVVINKNQPEIYLEYLTVFPDKTKDDSASQFA